MVKTINEQIKDAIASDKIIMGSKQTIKFLKLKSLKNVIVSTNCPVELKKDLTKYAEMAGIKVETIEGTSKQLGILCGKPFPITVLSIK